MPRAMACVRGRGLRLLPLIDWVMIVSQGGIPSAEDVWK